MHPILMGIVGSTAHGLAKPGSDQDTMGVFVHPTEMFFGLTKPIESRVVNDPDITLHEAAKFCRLALGCNPSLMEFLWLPADLYTYSDVHGRALIGIRDAFLSAQRVRDAYLGYASQQFKKLKDRNDGSFSSDTRKRTAKHARHLLRLLNQGSDLYLTGQLTVKVNDPEAYHKFGERVASGNTLYAERALSLAEQTFNEGTSPLAESPDVDRVEAWLVDVRRAYLYKTAHVH